MRTYSTADMHDALGAIHTARELGLAIDDKDLVILNRAAGSAATNTPETLAYGEFADALDRVQDAIYRACNGE